MKFIVRASFLLFVLSLFVACARDSSSHPAAKTAQTVDKVIADQIEKAMNQQDSLVKTVQPPSPSLSPSPSAPISLSSQKTNKEKPSSRVDFDLTSMSSDMVYALVSQLMTDPDPYIGKTLRIDGLYSSSYFEPTRQFYHYCVIQDATACCAQGLEFVWEDGSHAYPEEYPEENAEILVQGVFETYTEDGDSYVYSRLRDSSLLVL